MGFHEVTRVLATSKTTGYERLALVALAQRVNDDRGDGVAWPGIDTFAKDVNCSERFIQKIVKGWREAPQEVYVIDGGGRYKPNRYIILAGCSFNEVVRRLRINLNIQSAEAEQLASQMGYEKGEQVFTLAAGNGEHYDSKRVNIGTQNGEHYAETVNTGSPEQELKHQLKPQITEHQILSSSPAPVEAAVEEKEEIEPIPPSIIEDKSPVENPKTIPVIGNQPMIQGLSMLCYGQHDLSQKIAVKVAGGAARLLALGATPADLRRFAEYHRVQNEKRPATQRYDQPTVDYVLDGWGKFQTWWASHRDELVWDTIPGTANFLAMRRFEWDELAEMQPGDEIKIRGQWLYAKQADGTFTEIPHEQWPDWARESA
jgi:hypothetical protein